MTTLRAAAQQALEALEDMLSGYLTPYQAAKTSAALEAALAEPVQEPAAWQWLDTGTFRKKLPKTAERGAWNPLYAAPPQRKPLTDEEIVSIFRTSGSPTAFARAIEQAHGIKERT
jgi:hypothetical protein